MLIEPKDEPLVPSEERDPYGEVALGVECAWPETLPVLEHENPA